MKKEKRKKKETLQMFVENIDIWSRPVSKSYRQGLEVI